MLSSIDGVHLVKVVPVCLEDQSLFIDFLVEFCPGKRRCNAESSSRQTNLFCVGWKSFDFLCRLIWEAYHECAACSAAVFSYVPNGFTVNPIGDALFGLFQILGVWAFYAHLKIED